MTGLRFEPELLARVVADALDREQLAEYRRAAEPLYGLDEAEREPAFHRLDREFARRLGFEPLFEAAVADLPAIVRELLVAPAGRAADEGADWMSGPGRATLRVRPSRFRERENLRLFLRHELLHIADLVDPAFGYDGDRQATFGAGAEALVRDRYRVLWCASIDSRLGERASRLPAVLLAYGLGAGDADPLDRFLRSRRPTHAELLACARTPRELANLVPGLTIPAALAARTRCPLCRMPAFPAVTPAHDLPEAAQAAVRAQLGSWSPDDGLCGRCVEMVLLEGGSLCP